MTALTVGQLQQFERDTHPYLLLLVLPAAEITPVLIFVTARVWVLYSRIKGFNERKLKTQSQYWLKEQFHTNMTAKTRNTENTNPRLLLCDVVAMRHVGAVWNVDTTPWRDPCHCRTDCSYFLCFCIVHIFYVPVTAAEAIPLLHCCHEIVPLCQSCCFVWEWTVILLRMNSNTKSEQQYHWEWTVILSLNSDTTENEQ